MLLTDKSFCFFEINAWPLPPKNFTILTQKIKPVEQCKTTVWGWLSILGRDSRLSRTLIFSYLFETNGMLLTGKSFCFFEINAWPLPPKNFTILTQKLKPVEEWKDTGVYCQYYTIPWLYIHPSVYISMTNFSAKFKHENWSLKFPIVSFYVKKDD